MTDPMPADFSERQRRQAELTDLPDSEKRR